VKLPGNLKIIIKENTVALKETKIAVIDKIYE
jgi:hypothetical protein